MITLDVRAQRLANALTRAVAETARIQAEAAAQGAVIDLALQGHLAGRLARDLGAPDRAADLALQLSEARAQGAAAQAAADALRGRVVELESDYTEAHERGEEAARLLTESMAREQSVRADLGNSEMAYRLALRERDEAHRDLATVRTVAEAHEAEVQQLRAELAALRAVRHEELREQADQLTEARARTTRVPRAGTAPASGGAPRDWGRRGLGNAKRAAARGRSATRRKTTETL